MRLFRYAQVFNASTTTVAPWNLAFAPEVYSWGESGSAGTSNHGVASGGGAGAGAIGAELALAGVLPGTVLTITIGTGATATDTTVTGGTVPVTGAHGQNAAGPTAGNGGAAGSNSIAFKGGNGGAGGGGTSGGGAGGGSPGSTGAGGNGAPTGGAGGLAGTGAAGPPSLAGAAGAAGPVSTLAGLPGIAPGSGPSGGGGATGVNHVGGTPAPGRVIIIWTVWVQESTFRGTPAAARGRSASSPGVPPPPPVPTPAPFAPPRRPPVSQPAAVRGRSASSAGAPVVSPHFNTGVTKTIDQAASNTGTIIVPAGVKPGDDVFVFVFAFSFAGTGSAAITLTSTATAPAQLGTTQSEIGSGIIAGAALFHFTAGASDPGATLTFTMTGGGATSWWFNVSATAYTGFAGVDPPAIGGAGFFTGAGNGTTVTPAASTTRDGDWQLQWIGIGPPSGNNLATPGGLTLRESVGPGANAGLLLEAADSGGPAGPAGTSIGGTTWTGSPGTGNVWSTSFTVGLAVTPAITPAPFAAPARPPVSRPSAVRGRSASSAGAPVSPSPAPFAPRRAPAPRGTPAARRGRAASSPGARLVTVPARFRIPGPAPRPRASARRGRTRLGSSSSGAIPAPPPAPKTLLISLASAAGTDDFGNAYPQGIFAAAGVIEGPEFIGENFEINAAGSFYYSGTPAFGNLISSVAPADGTDRFGNAYLAGTASYLGGFSTWSANAVTGGATAWYTGPGAGGPWSIVGEIEIALIGTPTLVLDFLQLAGAINIPQPTPAASSAAIISMLQAAGVCL